MSIERITHLFTTLADSKGQRNSSSMIGMKAVKKVPTNNTRLHTNLDHSSICNIVSLSLYLSRYLMSFEDMLYLRNIWLVISSNAPQGCNRGTIVSNCRGSHKWKFVGGLNHRNEGEEGGCEKPRAGEGSQIRSNELLMYERGRLGFRGINETRVGTSFHSE